MRAVALPLRCLAPLPSSSRRSKAYDKRFLQAANRESGGPKHAFTWIDQRLDARSAHLANGCGTACIFVNDHADAAALEVLANNGIRLLALRSAGFSHVDLEAAKHFSISVARVPAYSPEAVAEHAVALIMALNRKIYRAFMHAREGNFALDGLLGFDVHGKTVGVIGTGQIGLAFSKIMAGFGCRLLGFDHYQNPSCVALGMEYRPLDALLAESDIISLHCPLTPETRHIIDDAALRKMKATAMIINTSRGALLDTAAVVEAVKTGRIGYLGMDVYEEEELLFFKDLSSEVITDDVFARLLTFNNVLVTGHQGFFTEEALRAIASTTIANISNFARTGMPLHPVVL
ncbi:D-isomer specific 2-hydroxyacid dehydrogenase [Hyaloraphidium curvatum]|nr:D-isomer specific 2-hydroxyacid dehydrogenase [Hyaloraphidium curvatum]